MSEWETDAMLEIRRHEEVGGSVLVEKRSAWRQGGRRIQLGGDILICAWRPFPWRVSSLIILELAGLHGRKK
jgi:hypothetical protein